MATKVEPLAVAAEGELVVAPALPHHPLQPLDVAPQRVEAARQHVVPGDQLGAPVAAARQEAQARAGDGKCQGQDDEGGDQLDERHAGLPAGRRCGSGLLIALCSMRKV